MSHAAHLLTVTSAPSVGQLAATGRFSGNSYQKVN